MNLRIADLHTHSNVSDGELSPSDLVSRAAACGLHVLALTDHDCVSGSDQALATAGLSIEVVPGIEISAEHGGGHHHVLGLFVDPRSQSLRRYEAAMTVRRRERLEQMVVRLVSAGVRISKDDVLALASGVVTRSHLARHMVDSGISNSVGEVFRDYLGPSGIGFVPAGSVTVKEAIALIHEAGGCSVLAHPADWTSEDDIRAFARMGLDGIEVVHPMHDPRLEQYYSQLARTLGLGLSGGSDFHADRDGGIRLGEKGVVREWCEDLRRRARGLK